MLYSFHNFLFYRFLLCYFVKLSPFICRTIYKIVEDITSFLDKHFFRFSRSFFALYCTLFEALSNLNTKLYIFMSLVYETIINYNKKETSVVKIKSPIIRTHRHRGKRALLFRKAWGMYISGIAAIGDRQGVAAVWISFDSGGRGGGKQQQATRWLLPLPN